MQSGWYPCRQRLRFGFRGSVRTKAVGSVLFTGPSSDPLFEHPQSVTVETLFSQAFAHELSSQVMQQQTILVVEDEKPIAEIIVYNLEKEGFKVIWERDGISGLERARSVVPDAVVLDLMLPGMDGLRICRALRGDTRTSHIRVVMLTARAEETDEIIGFNVGADDYVTKPFRVRPLIHRIKALLRRNDAAGERDRIEIHGLEIDRTQHRVTCEGQELDLTPTEFRLLWTLAGHPGRPFSRMELIDIARGEDANSLERTIDVHVRSLRKKLGDAAGIVETVRGVGYRLLRR